MNYHFRPRLAYLALSLVVAVACAQGLMAQSSTTQIPIDTLMKYGIIKFKVGAYKASVVDFSAVLQRDRRHYSALLYRGEARRLLMDSLGALYDFSQAVKFYPDSAEPYFQRALSYKSMESGVEMEIELDRAISLNPRNPEYLYERGLARLIKKEFEKSIEDFNQFLTIKPGHAKALYNRGYAYFQLRKPEAAVVDLSESIITEPTAEAYYQRALIKQFYKKYNDAILDFDYAISLDPTYAEAKYARGVLLANTGNQQGLKDLAEVGLSGYQKAADALRSYKENQRDSMMIYQVPEIIVEATRPEYQEALAESKRVTQVGNTAINLFVSSPFGKFDGQIHPLLRVDGPEGLPGQWSVNDGQCNSSLMQTLGSSRISIFCIVYLLRQRVDILNDPMAEKLMREVEDYLNQVDNVRVTVRSQDRNQPEQISRLRELIIQMQVSINRLQTRITKIQELTALRQFQSSSDGKN